MKTLALIEKSRYFWFLLIVSLLFFLLRFPSLFEPYWYGDEGIYQVLGKGIQEGKLLYRDIWDNKPPLLYVFYAIFSSDQFSLRLFSIFFGLSAIYSFFFFAKTLFTSFTNDTNKVKKITIGTTVVFAFLFGIPLLEGNIANAENFMLFPIILAGFLIYKTATQQTNNRTLIFHLSFLNFQLLLAGLLLGIAFLIKIVALFDFAAFFVFFFITRGFTRQMLPLTIKQLMIFSLGFLVPLGITSLFFLLQGAFTIFFKAVFLHNIGYVGYGNSFFIPQGLLFFKLTLLGLFLIMLFIKRKTFNTATLLIFIWFAFSLFNTFFSQRPYTHYVLVLLPSLCLMIGILYLEKTYKKLLLVSFAISLIIVYQSFYFYKKNIAYYQNFFAFLTQEKSVRDYHAFFDQQTNKDAEIVQFIKTHTDKNDTIFLWSNSAQVYYLTNKFPPGKYTVAYHILSSSATIDETNQALLRTKPRYIVINQREREFPFFLGGYYPRMTLTNTVIYERY